MPAKQQESSLYGSVSFSHATSHIPSGNPKHSCAFDRVLWCRFYDVCSEIACAVLLCCRLMGSHDSTSKIKGCHSCYCHLHNTEQRYMQHDRPQADLTFPKLSREHRHKHFISPLLWACSSRAEVSELHIPMTRLMVGGQENS